MTTTSDTPTAASVPVTIRVQSVLYTLEPHHIHRALEYVDRAAELAIASGQVAAVEVAYGDCSPMRTLDEAALQDLRTRFGNLRAIDYSFYDANLGSAEGHNRLLANAETDFLMVLNPDCLVAPDIFEKMMLGLRQPGVGLVEARQLPIEHPKDYDPVTGETSWGSTACVMVSTALAKEVDGFDSATFFLYCDDVDFSWRIRLAGYKVIHQPAAVIFHDKRIGEKGNWQAGAAEAYYSAEAGLLLPYKYSRDDLVKKRMLYFKASGEPHLLKAAANFEERSAAGKLPRQIDGDHRVGQFVGNNYAVHRFETT